MHAFWLAETRNPEADAQNTRDQQLATDRTRLNRLLLCLQPEV